MPGDGGSGTERRTPGPDRRISGWTILTILIALILTALVAAALVGAPTIR